MSEHPFDELERLGETPVPPVDASFADRLESDLRVRHGGRRRGPAWAPGWRRATLGLAAVVCAVVGVIGLGQLRIGDDDVPVEIAGPEHDGSEVAAEPPDVGDDGDDGDDGADSGLGGGGAETEGAEASALASEPTPIPTPLGDEATSGGGGSVAPDLTTPAPAGTPTPDQTPTSGDSTGTRPATPLPTPTVPPRPTTTPSPTPVPREPLPTTERPPVTVVPTMTPEPVDTETPTPAASATPAPVALDAVCALRAGRDALGVICEWQPPPDLDIGRFTVHRTRNGGPRELVANVAAPRTQAADRDVGPGDSVVYVVTGLVGDAVRAVSERLAVRIPPS